MIKSRSDHVSGPGLNRKHTHLLLVVLIEHYADDIIITVFSSFSST